VLKTGFSATAPALLYLLHPCSRALLPLYFMPIPILTEKTVSIDTTASGGNTSLMALVEADD